MRGFGREAREDALLRRVKQYDEEALEAIYDEYAPLVYSYIYRRVGDAMLAESLVGEVFARVLSAIRSQRAWRKSFRGWLYRIAHNLVVDQYRRQPDDLLELEEGRLVGGREPADVLREKASRERLLAAVQELTAGQQQVLVLRFGEGLTAREVAKVMGRSVSAVESLQHRGLEALRRRLGEGEG
jgi:RNA polymerase sigma-70 factor (ECF subfamily)